ncbi:GerAB/ArcD/ProY family transporter [Priestia megaterium]|nr:GerAB/ArcD/ProY family transporter [Priestia megaterium]
MTLNKVNDIQINEKQFFILSLLFLVGDAILYVPSLVSQEAKHGVWIVGIIGIIEAVLLSLLYSSLGKQLANTPFVTYIETLFGKWIGKLLAFSFLCYVMVDVILMIYEMGSFMVTMIMAETPIISIILIFLIAITIGARLGLEVLARSAEILFPWFFTLYLIMFLLNLPNIEFKNMHPLFESGLHSLYKGNLPLLSYTLESVILVMIFPYVNGTSEAKKAYVTGITIGVILLVILTLLSLLVFGLGTLSIVLYPSYLLGQELELGFITRIEVIIAIIWFISIFFKIGICFLVSSLGLSQIMQMKDYRIITFSLALICIPDNVYLGTFIETTWISYSLTYGLLFPLVLFGIGLMRKKKESSK